MNSGKISTRYARALLMSAKEKKTEDLVYAEFSAMGMAFDQYPEIEAALASPTITDSEKKDLLISVAGGKKASPDVLNFINFVIDEKREEYMPSIVRMYEQIYRKEKNIVISTLTSASELSKESFEAIKKYISKLSGSNNIEVRQKIDSGIIGGFILDIESNRMDASIKGQLSNLEYYARH
ncbi:MAG: F0F1 ATP synthase subunit delta [Paludibacteraceae bacterium]|nr:F0F1 ATP synthase subunit delta [Paludibacteraceae bacterium]MBQ1752798.1 F0F1 ATP synthase subunit delta [Paludibacteraceae bacterium]MBQ1851111.1 F0F1 ATP synthase subunit delta [Paludibacteraceae bacterium]MBQ2065594.1 F0F1 ATP synthase subunit delta [Paludibacteraceae bacterium]MBQ4032905.1 F0F1 ATP synthase subunit delta [Paludibacteraceae bacterium]